jgi:uncharacterized membrane protein
MYRFHRFIRHRPRLTIAISVGISVALTLPSAWPLITRSLAAWNVTVWFYLILMTWLMMRASHARVRKIAQQEDKSGFVVLLIMSIAAVASFAAIILELVSLKGLSMEFRLVHYALTGATVCGSWLLIGILYTFHYARLFYTSPPELPALIFPDKEPNPNYWDFLYFSFTIAVAAQTSDITVMTRPMRKTVLAQSILSFFFNVTIVGLSINIVAGLLNP